MNLKEETEAGIGERKGERKEKMERTNDQKEAKIHARVWRFPWNGKNKRRTRKEEME